MGLSSRFLKISITPQGADKSIVLDQSLRIHARIHKAALAIQARATIEVYGMSQTLRQSLLSQFTAWNKRKVDTGQASAQYANIIIEAGWTPSGNSTKSSVVFKGQVVLVNLISGPPDIGVQITCYSRQIDKTQFISEPAPYETTYKAYVTWAAKQMGFDDKFICETSFDNETVWNPARSILTRAALLIDIQNMYRPDVAAFVDDDFLIVKDRNKIINPSEISNITEFVGIPSWTAWGVEFVTLFDQSIKLAQAATLNSKLNPSVNQTYVITELEYDLSSRDTPFYVKASGSPPA